MKRKLSLLVAMLPLLLTAATSYGQATDQATATAKARIIEPIDVVSEKDLNFGAMIQLSSGSGTVTVTPNNVYTGTASGTITPSGVILVSQGELINGAKGQARFRVRGEPGYHFQIHLPPASPVFNIRHDLSSSQKLDVTNFTSNPPNSGVLNGLGIAYFNVGATLQLVSGRPTGLYSKEFVVVVNYE
jgi:hypothetical protein